MSFLVHRRRKIFITTFLFVSLLVLQMIVVPAWHERFIRGQLAQNVRVGDSFLAVQDRLTRLGYEHSFVPEDGMLYAKRKVWGWEPFDRIVGVRISVDPSGAVTRSEVSVRIIGF
jgi:hypothetical protein